MEFEVFRDLLQEHVASMVQDQRFLFFSGVDKDELWNKYLDSFPAGTNEIYRERRYHDCSCCRNFIRQVGGVVTIKDYKIVTAWYIEGAGDVYQPVADAMAAFIRECLVSGVFVTKQVKFGAASTLEQLDSGQVHEWKHFSLELPKRFATTLNKTEDTIAATHKTAHDTFKRALEELSPYSIETVLDLVAEKSLYRGEEWVAILTKFSGLQAKYLGLPENERDNFCWIESAENGPVISKIRNHSIGVLLQDITAGMDVLDAVKRYEKVVAPTNYKRPKEIFTAKMVKQAEEAVTELGLIDSLPRRFATLRDIKPQDVIFVDRDARKVMVGASGAFASLMEDVIVKPESYKNAQAIEIGDFITAYLPKTSRVEVLLENRLVENLVSIIAPGIEGSKSMLMWPNGFGWAYTGNKTDSEIKKNVEKFGGKVHGVVLRFSIQWNDVAENLDDLDAHAVYSGGKRHIYFGDKHDRLSGGNLDVDIINPRGVAVENIVFPYLDRMPEGEYHFFVRQYSARGGKGGFRAEIEFDNQLYQYDWPNDFNLGRDVTVARLLFKDGKFSFISSLDEKDSSKTVWGLGTNKWQRVSLVMLSPNHWHGSAIGNKHYMFMLAGAVNDERPNGFFNEFLPQELMEYKRVFAALGSKMKVPDADADNQLSGLGFSSTVRNSLPVRLDGGKILKVIF